MKVSYPLSLKVSLWLMLNLLLLAALGLGFFVVRGGLGWGALVVGRTGDRTQALFNGIAGEASAAAAEARAEVLNRFGEAHNAQFALFALDESQIAGAPLALPPEVRERMEFRGTGWSFFGGPRGGAPGARPPGYTGPPSTDRLTGRFVVRGGSPAGYWVGMRVPFVQSERSGRPMPAKLVARVGSLWSLLSLLGLQTVLVAAGGALALSVIFWLPLVRSITRSLGQLGAATEKIAEGRFDTRVAAHRRDEIGQLGESVNRMAARLDAHMTGQKRFLGDVAHELCSPLARLQLATGILAEQAPKNLADTVADVRDEVQQMSALVNELLAFTKAGLQAREAALAPTPLAPLARAAVHREGGDGRVALDVPPDLAAQADADALGRAVGNLVRNALRYAGAAGPIALRAARDGDRVALAVEDSGPGVPVADLDRLGEPFFRPELARTREGGGVGLGLAIVRQSVAACGGEVRFSNRAPQGFRAEIRLKAV